MTPTYVVAVFLGATLVVFEVLRLVFLDQGRRLPAETCTTNTSYE